LVVVKGNFKIDSALQIQAKPSMMNPPAKQSRGNEPHPTYEHYFAIQTALANDQFEQAKTAAMEMANALTGEDELKTHLETFALATELTTQRNSFDLISQLMIDASRSSGAVGTKAFYVVHCPMAMDNQGADWLQADQQVRNPYFGASMLKCGRISETISARTAEHD